MATKNMDSSTFVEVGSEDSDYELDFVRGVKQENESGKGHDIEEGEIGGGLAGQMSHGVATYVWQEGRQRAKRAFSLYANIDVLRPYFDVEPHEVRNRLFASLIPRFQVSSDSQSHVPSELYGPTMLVLTLIAMLLYQMKSQDVSVQEGTLMGTAFGTCFGYWFGTSGLLFLTAYVCGTHITMLQLLNLLGYGLFGPCVVLFLSTVFHPAHDHVFFYSLWFLFGGLASLKMASVLMSRTSYKTQKLVVCALVVSVHLLFLLYLHFAYHHVVEDLSAAFDKIPLRLPATTQFRSVLVDPVSVTPISGAGRGQSLLVDNLKVKRSVLKASALPLQTVMSHLGDVITSSQINNTLVMVTERIRSLNFKA